MRVKEEGVFSKGLENVVATESSICVIDGRNSKLFYRGYDIHDLAQRSHFEETAYLLLFGELPTKVELEEFKRKLSVERALPREIVREMEIFPKKANAMAALRTAVSLLSFYDPEAEDKSQGSDFRKAVRLIAKAPTLVTYFEHLRKGESVVPPKTNSSVSMAANFLYMHRGREASPLEVQMLDKYFILLAEHDLNASTFAARITASTTSDMYSAITSAVGTLKGDLHGSANTRTMESLMEIADAKNVEPFVDRMLAEKKKLMGFGHRIYKGPDPRADDLRVMSKALADANPSQAHWYEISHKLEKIVWERKSLNCNVDFYSASVLYILGIPTDMFTAIFAISRMAGWTAHYLEQIANNRLIRPVSHYTGQSPRPYVPIQERV